MKQPIDNFTAGIVYDDADFNLVDGVFSDGRNVRVRAGTVEKVKGSQTVLGSLSVTPCWAESVTDGVNAYWVYASTDKIYGTDGATHAQINSVSFNAGVDLGWTGGKYHGYLIMNDGQTDPQSWVPGLANKVQPLANWPSGVTCKVIRSFGDFLVALRITQGGNYNPRLLRWSDAGAFAALPGSWDYTDPTNQAGITELGQTDDQLVDCLPLRDSNIIYKQFNTWLMQPVGLPDVFSFRQLFNQSGLLTENCAAAFGTQHCVLSDNDIIVHDGASATSIGGKHRRWLFNRMSTTRYNRSFVVPNYREREMWICVAETGYEYPNIALVWNWAENNFHVRELGLNMAYGSNGIVNGTDLTFDAQSGTFDSDSGSFDDSTFSPFAQRMVLWTGESQNAYQSDTTELLVGQTMTAYIERSNMALTHDVGSIKRIKAIYPKIYGTSGDAFLIYVGSRETPDSAITYSGPFSFTVGTDYKIDCRVSGRYISVKMQTAVTNTWRMSGFDIEFDRDGRR